MINVQTFTRSFGNLLNLSPNDHSRPYNVEDLKYNVSDKSDAEQMRSDFAHIGKDIEIAMKNFEKENF